MLDMIDWNDTLVKMIIYFIYGTTLILMFLIMTLWKNRISHIELLYDFKYLAIFALLHGLTEYSEIPRILSWEPSWAFDMIELILVISSFTALLAFGVNIISAGVEEYRWLRGIPLGAIWMYVWLLVFIGLDFTNNNIGINYKIADLAQRYTLGFLGALITTYAFMDLANKIRVMIGEKAENRFIYAGLGFAYYTLFGGLIVDPIFGIPVIVYRTVIAIFMTLSVIGIFQLFEVKNKVTN